MRKYIIIAVALLMAGCARTQVIDLTTKPEVQEVIGLNPNNTKQTKSQLGSTYDFTLSN